MSAFFKGPPKVDVDRGGAWAVFDKHGQVSGGLSKGDARKVAAYLRYTKGAGFRVGAAGRDTTNWRKNPTHRSGRAQQREATRKRAVQRRVAVALSKYLKQVNPGKKLAGAKVEKLKGGVLKITPIKANAAGKGNGFKVRKDYNQWVVYRGIAVHGLFETKAEALKLQRKLNAVRR